MKTIYIVALCFDEEFHDNVTDAEHIKAAFLSREEADKYILTHYFKELSAVAYDKEWKEKSSELYEKFKTKLNSKNTKTREDAEMRFNALTLEILKKYGFEDSQEYYKYHGKKPQVFETKLQ